MNKEQIRQEFDKILAKVGLEFFENGISRISPCFYKEDFVELLEIGFNLGLEVAADNAEADYTFVQVDDFPEEEFEVYVLKNSILKFKL